jgi:uroporphyrin-III C-methyltransferase / precorrin-2 dehydrogenase / sirohydrochlorin ferrochelatase
MDFMPIFTKLTGRPVLVIGGGVVAYRKIRLLLDAGARVTIVANDYCQELNHLIDAGRVHTRPGPFHPDMLDGHVLTYAATDDPELNASVFAAGERVGRLVNAVDDPEHCNFITPAIVDRSPLVAAISSGGAAPVLARNVRMALETRWPETLGPLAQLIRKHRDRVASHWSDVDQRRRFYESLLDHIDLHAQLRAGDLETAETTYLDAFEQASRTAPPDGHVVLVGAGPGDPGLLTLQALRHLERADVILYDRLVPDDILAKCRRDAKLLSVEKMPNGNGWSQDAILDELLAHARAGLYVVRLKSGDPFVFGRGGEEMAFLQSHGIQVEIVPGITAALGCAASAGIPLTHRDHGHSLRLITAMGRHGDDDPLDDPNLAAPDQMLVIYMGVRAAPRIQAALIQHGRDPHTPVAIIERGTRPGQRTLFGVLHQLQQLVLDQTVQAPALLFIGEPVACAPGYHVAQTASSLDTTWHPTAELALQEHR